MHLQSVLKLFWKLAILVENRVVFYVLDLTYKQKMAHVIKQTSDNQIDLRAGGGEICKVLRI